MRAKKPTLTQKKLMTANRLDWQTWNVLSENAETLVLISKKSNRKRTIHK